MASADVDLKILGRFASSMQLQHPLLAQSLFQIFGILTMLSMKITRARKLRELGPTQDGISVDLYHRVIWYAREGLKILEEYVFPMVVNYRELKVLAYKLRASFYHIYVIFNNQPPIYLESSQISMPPRLNTPPADSEKGKGVSSSDPMQSTHPLEGCVAEPSQISWHLKEFDPTFLLAPDEYRPLALRYFEEATTLAEFMLGGNHPLRLSIRVEIVAFLYDCLYDWEGSRRLAAATITDFYNAQEEMEDEMFEDATELVVILGRMAKRESGPGESSAIPARHSGT